MAICDCRMFDALGYHLSDCDAAPKSKECVRPCRAASGLSGLPHDPDCPAHPNPHDPFQSKRFVDALFARSKT